MLTWEYLQGGGFLRSLLIQSLPRWQIHRCPAATAANLHPPHWSQDPICMNDAMIWNLGDQRDGWKIRLRMWQPKQNGIGCHHYIEDRHHHPSTRSLLHRWGAISKERIAWSANCGLDLGPSRVGR